MKEILFSNAHLIAAAPEMFKLLKSIQQSRTFAPSDFDLVDQVIARANSAE